MATRLLLLRACFVLLFFCACGLRGRVVLPFVRGESAASCGMRGVTWERDDENRGESVHGRGGLAIERWRVVMLCVEECARGRVCAEGIRMRETVDFRVMLRGVLSCGLTVRVCSSV